MKFFIIGTLAILAVAVVVDGCDPCNDGIDHVLKETNTDIGKRSPLVRTNKEYCDTLTFWGGNTMVRNGNICSQTEGDCIISDFKIFLQNLTFNCLCNMEMIAKAMDQFVNNPGAMPGKMSDKIKGMGRKRRGGLGGLGDLDEPEATIVGHWLNVCVGGQIKICKNNPKNSDVMNLGLCDLNMENCELTCKGDPKLEGLCAQDQFIGKFKEALGAAVQVVSQGEIRNSIVNGPSNIVSKFNCEYAKTG